MAIDPEIRSILVYVGLDRVGDGLLKLPFVRGLRDAFPQARISWLAGKETSVYARQLAPLVDGCLDEIIEHAGIGLHPSELLKRPLPNRQFDLIIDSQKIVWASLSLWRIPHRQFISPAARFLFSSKKPPKGYKFPKSMQRQLLDLLELASNQTFETPETLDLDLNPALHADAADMLPDGPVYVGIAPGSGGLPKCWPLDRFIALGKAQTERGRVPVFVLGPAEPHWQAEIEAVVPEALFPLQMPNVVKRHNFDPMFTIALAGRFAVGLANDSGVGHMFAISGRPLVSLFGTTVPEKFMPMGRDLTIIRASDQMKEDGTRGREMADIPYSVVAEAVESSLASAGFGGG